MRRLLRQILVGLLIVSACFGVRMLAQKGATSGDWRVYGGDAGSTRYSPLDQINRDNIKNLKVAWVWKSDSLMLSPQSVSETTPIMVNGVIYFTMHQRRYVIA